MDWILVFFVAIWLSLLAYGVRDTTVRHAEAVGAGRRKTTRERKKAAYEVILKAKRARKVRNRREANRRRQGSVAVRRRCATAAPLTLCPPARRRAQQPEDAQRLADAKSSPFRIAVDCQYTERLDRIVRAGKALVVAGTQPRLTRRSHPSGAVVPRPPARQRVVRAAGERVQGLAAPVLRTRRLGAAPRVMRGAAVAGTASDTHTHTTAPAPLTPLCPGCSSLAGAQARGGRGGGVPPLLPRLPKPRRGDRARPAQRQRHIRGGRHRRPHCVHRACTCGAVAAPPLPTC